MGDAAYSLHEHVGDQLRRLCAAIDLEPDHALTGVRELLGPGGAHPLGEPPWPTDVSDDHTPVEFSVACQAGAAPALRILGETIAEQPGRQANLRAALRLVDLLAARLDLTLDRFHEVRQVFLGGPLDTDFSMWFSLVHRQASAPDVKVYFNPNTQGTHRAPHLVAEAFRLLGLDGAYRRTLAHAVRPGGLGDRDRLTFFAVDLHARANSRVKLYVSHHDSEVADVLRAASAMDGVDTTAIRDFLALTGCAGRLTGRPAISGYTFVQNDTDRPSTYSLYLPVRDYVGDDERAREMVVAVWRRFGLDPAVIDRAIAAVTGRPLGEGVGLIAHVSLRLTPGGPPGLTLYLSSEAYQVSAPRCRSEDASSDPVAPLTGENSMPRVSAQIGSASCR